MGVSFLDDVAMFVLHYAPHFREIPIIGGLSKLVESSAHGIRKRHSHHHSFGETVPGSQYQSSFNLERFNELGNQLATKPFHVVAPTTSASAIVPCPTAVREDEPEEGGDGTLGNTGV